MYIELLSKESYIATFLPNSQMRWFIIAMHVCEDGK